MQRTPPVISFHRRTRLSVPNCHTESIDEECKRVDGLNSLTSDQQRYQIHVSNSEAPSGPLDSGHTLLKKDEFTSTLRSGLHSIQPHIHVQSLTYVRPLEVVSPHLHLIDPTILTYLPPIHRPPNPLLTQLNLRRIEPQVIYLQYICEDECRSRGICLHYSFVLGCRKTPDGLICGICQRAVMKSTSAKEQGRPCMVSSIEAEVKLQANRICPRHNKDNMVQFMANLPEDILATPKQRLRAGEILKRSWICNWTGISTKTQIEKRKHDTETGESASSFKMQDQSDVAEHNCEDLSMPRFKRIKTGCDTMTSTLTCSQKCNSHLFSCSNNCLDVPQSSPSSRRSSDNVVGVVECSSLHLSASSSLQNTNCGSTNTTDTVSHRIPPIRRSSLPSVPISRNHEEWNEIWEDLGFTK